MQICSGGVMQANDGINPATFFFFTFIGRFLFLAVVLLGIRRICLC